MTLKRSTRKKAVSDIEKHQIQTSQSVMRDDDYIYLSKKFVLQFFLSLISLLAIILLLNSVLTETVRRSFIEKSAVWLYKKPLLKPFVQARWLPQSFIINQVLPEKGYQTKITLGDVVPKMVEAGIIDREKIEALYSQRGGMPEQMQELLSKPSNTPLFITKENTAWLINLLWPLGLSNKMTINERSPIAGKNVGKFASTGGWSLGKQANGGVYFNSVKLIPLSQQQEKRVQKLAETIYRPCCNNSAFFQDCNHGSAALALVTLGVAQGLSDKEIYKTVLRFNSFWFPYNYTTTALYLQRAKNLFWEDVDPKLLLSKDYSSISGWMANVYTPAKKIEGLLPETQGGGSCGA